MNRKCLIIFIGIVTLVIQMKILSRILDTKGNIRVPDAKGNFSNRTERQGDVEGLDDVGPDSSSVSRKHILLLATTRTGSSFVGEFFNQHGQNMFYLFEPLWHVHDWLNTTAEASNGTVLGGIYRNVLQGLFLCDFSPLEKFISPPPQDHVTAGLFRRESSSALCEEPVCSPVVKEVFERFNCPNCGPLNFTLASESCLSKKYHAIKVVRILQLTTLQPMLEDPHLDVTVIQLVRDPRASLQSSIVVFPLQFQNWTNLAEDGQVPEDDWELRTLKRQCEDIQMSAEVGLSQPHWLRSRYMLVRYEDIVRYPVEKAEEMYRFTGIPYSPQAREWILKNTQTSVSEPYSTQRNASEQIDKWRFQMNFTLVQAVQRVCGPMMNFFGYKFVDDAQILTDRSISLIEDNLFSQL